MTGTLFAVIGVLLCAAVLAVMLRPQRPELAMAVGMTAGLAVLFTLLRELTPIFTSVRNMMQTGNFPTEYLTVVLKAAGITVLTQLTADTCRDAGETALAGKAELAGRILMLTLAVPLFERILSLVTALVNGQAVGG